MLRPAIAAVLLVLGAPATAAATPSAVETLAKATPVSSYGGATAWSRPTADGYRLVVALGAAPPRELPVPSRAVPFDVDLGPGEDGAVVAVYSRCRVEPATVEITPPLPTFTAGRGCDVFRVGLDGGSERRVPGASTAGASEMLPSIWRERLAFARVYDRRTGIRDGLALSRLPYLYRARLDGRGGSERLPGDLRGSTGVPGPVALDLYGAWLGLVWELQGMSESPTYRARVVREATDTRLVATVAGGGLSRAWFAGASFDRGAFLFGLECLGDPGGCGDQGLRRKLVRYRLATGATDVAQLPGGSGQLVDLSAARGTVATLIERAVSPPVPTSPACSALSDGGTVCDLASVPTAELSFRPPPRRLHLGP